MIYHEITGFLKGVSVDSSRVYFYVETLDGVAGYKINVETISEKFTFNFENSIPYNFHIKSNENGEHYLLSVN